MPGWVEGDPGLGLGYQRRPIRHRRWNVSDGLSEKMCHDVPHNKPLKLPAAGFSCAGAVRNADRNSITRGRSLAAIR